MSLSGQTSMCAMFQTKLRESRIFSSLRKAQNLVSSRGLVKISASCFSVLTWRVVFVVSQEVMTDVYVFSSRVTNGVICKFDGTLVVTQERYLGELTSEIF